MTLRDTLLAALRKESPEELQAFLEQNFGDDLTFLQELRRRLGLRERSAPAATVGAGDGATGQLSADRVILADIDAVHAAYPMPRLADAALPAGAVLGGKYKIHERLGSGGMGEVYAAEQFAPIERRVAVKVIRAGMDTEPVLARFEQERQALALMDHPHIARLHDAGATDQGQPYFVMELVKGLAITRFCDHEKLTMRQRLELFIPICRAVQHAHQKGIIHRDLKPSNLLVSLVDGKPMPKIIDFGVAKALFNRLTTATIYTEINAVVGTLEYMAPEQAEFTNLDIDTRVDVYSLGVVLYELLTGVLPFSRKDLLRGALDEMLRVIREVDPARPSTRVSTLKNAAAIAASRKSDPEHLCKLLSGELDWIVLKCLEKERNRRYDSAAMLALDLERYLTNQPVTAAPPSKAYRMRKFIQRHRAGVLATSLATLALVAGAVAATVGMIQARRALEVAENEAAIHKMLVEFVDKDIFSALDPAERILAGLPAESDVKLKALLDRAARQIESSRFATQPLTEAALRATIGNAYFAVGAFAEAREHLLRADQLRAQHLGEKDPARLQVLEALCMAYDTLGQQAEATGAANFLVQARSEVLGANDPATLAARRLLYSFELHRRQFAEAEAHLRALADDQRRLLGPNHADTLSTLCTLADALEQQAKTAEAEALLAGALQAYRATLGNEHPRTLAAMNNLAHLLRAKPEQTPAAQALYEELVQTGTHIYGAENLLVALYKNNLGEIYYDQGNVGSAETLFKEALAVFQKQIPAHGYTLVVKYNLANLKTRTKDFAAAIDMLEELLPAAIAAFGQQDQQTWLVMRDLGTSYLLAERLDQAIEFALRHLSILRAQPVLDPGRCVRVLQNLQRAYVLQNKSQQAKAALRDALTWLPNDAPERKTIEEWLRDLPP